MRWQKDLVRDIRFGDTRDDMDFSRPEHFPNLAASKSWRGPKRAFSINDGIELKKQFDTVKDNCKVILEIGVDRNKNTRDPKNDAPSSTDVFLDNKNKDTIYLGVDIADKSYLDDPINNVYTIQCRSEEFDKVRSKLKSLGVDKVDFYFIDGWHSINQVLLEWEYTDLLSDTGIVGFHDTRFHPGPHYFINNLDTNIWNVIPDACAEHIDDYGIGFVSRK